jgi:hypothetical protein
MSSIPIPNGDLTLNGPELISDARADQEALRTELKEILDELTYDKLAQREAEQAQMLEEVLKRIPLGIYVGNFLLFFLTSYMLHSFKIMGNIL